MLDYFNLLLFSFSFCSSFQVGTERIAFLLLCVFALALVCSHKCRYCQGTKRWAQPIFCLGVAPVSRAHHAHCSQPAWARNGRQLLLRTWGNKGSSKSQIIPLESCQQACTFRSTLARYALAGLSCYICFLSATDPCT